MFNSDNNSCTLKSSLQLEVVTSIAGFQYSPQSYVIGAELSGSDDTWFFPAAKSSVTFTHFLSVSFRKALKDDTRDSADTLVKTIAGDLFYPLNPHAFH